ncbi:MAG: hypothetical protein AAF548_18920, partial [Actinomycetota bacterium]
MNRRIAAALVALAVGAAACGDDGGGEATVPVVSSTTSEPTSTTSSEVDAPEAAELRASFRGVSETEIQLGIGIIDASAFGFDNGDQRAQWQVAIDRANEAGGVLGRRLVPHFQSYLPVGSVEPEAACAVHVEDVGVFALLGALRDNNELCYTELGDTLVINTFPVSDVAVTRSGGLLFSTEPQGLDRELEGIALLADVGSIADERFAVRALPAQESYLEPIVDAIEAAGGEVVSVTVQSTDAGDVVSAASEADLALELATTNGATAFYGVGDIGLGMAGAVERAGSDVALYSPSAGASTFLTFGYDLTAIDYTALNRQPMREVYEAGEPGAVECVDEYESRTGNTVNVGVPNPEVDNFEVLLRTCRAIEMFVAIAEAAGAELTNAAFVEAAARLGPFELTASPGGALGPGAVGADE